MNNPSLSHNQIANLLASNVEASYDGQIITTVVRGENGVGKTALYHSLKEIPALAKHHFVPIVDCQNLDVGDHMIPVPDFDMGVSRNLPNERYGIDQLNHFYAKDSRPIVVCLDELFKAPRHVQASIMPVVYEHRLGKFRAPKGSIVFATSNLGVEGLGDMAPAHSLNRIEGVTMRKPTAVEWVRDYGVPHNVSEYLLAFADQYPDAWKSFLDYEGKNVAKENEYIYNPAAQQQAYFSPRSAVRASNRLKYGLDRLDDDTLLAGLIGTIGAPAARTLWALVSLRSEMIRFEEVIADPKKARMCANPIAQIVQVFQFVTRTEDNVQADAVLQYVRRMRGESQGLFCRTVSENLSKAAIYCRVADFSHMLADHKLAFAGGV